MLLFSDLYCQLEQSICEDDKAKLGSPVRRSRLLGMRSFLWGRAVQAAAGCNSQQQSRVASMACFHLGISRASPVMRFGGSSLRAWFQGRCPLAGCPCPRSSPPSPCGQGRIPPLRRRLPGRPRRYPLRRLRRCRLLYRCLPRRLCRRARESLNGQDHPSVFLLFFCAAFSETSSVHRKCL